jgi:hypothetical protein
VIAKAVADEEERRKRAEDEARQAEAERLADDEERQKRTESKALVFLRGSRWRIAAALLLLVGFPSFVLVQKHKQDAEFQAKLEKSMIEAADEKRQLERSNPPSNEQAASVAQRVVLYDEDPNDPTGKQYVGSAIWYTGSEKGFSNQKADLIVRADIEIPDRKFKMTIMFRRNPSSLLSTSHTAEFWFKLPQDFSGGGIQSVPGILMKSNEQARGTALSTINLKLPDGTFLVGLSDSDRAKNLQLLKERSWFDVPLVYTDQRRATISFEKGATGERAFKEAFAAWGD